MWFLDQLATPVKCPSMDEQTLSSQWWDTPQKNKLSTDVSVTVTGLCLPQLFSYEGIECWSFCPNTSSMPVPAQVVLEKPVSCSLPTPVECNLSVGSHGETKCSVPWWLAATTLQKTPGKEKAMESPLVSVFLTCLLDLWVTVQELGATLS